MFNAREGLNSMARGFEPTTYKEKSEADTQLREDMFRQELE